MKVLVVVSSTDRVPGTDHSTGTWLEEFAGPYYAFIEAGAQLTVASPNGGAAPIDPTSQLEAAQTGATRRFRGDQAAQRVFGGTVTLSSIRAGDFDAVFYCGGLGPVFDLSEDPASIALIEAMDRAAKPIAAVCHGVAVLRHARKADGSPLVEGRAVTGYSNSEERAVQNVDLVPFTIEDEMRRLGGRYTCAGDEQVHVAVDGHLITGQNPASAIPAAKHLLHQVLCPVSV
jgi:putative intracellular protease/amidase